MIGGRIMVVFFIRPAFIKRRMIVVKKVAIPLAVASIVKGEIALKGTQSLMAGIGDTLM